MIATASPMTSMAYRLIAERHAKPTESQRVADVLRQVETGLPFRATFKVQAMEPGTLIYLEALHPDSRHGPDSTPIWWTGRSWYVPSTSDTESIVRTALMAVETYMLHELRENFKFAGRVVFDPHKEVL